MQPTHNLALYALRIAQGYNNAEAWFSARIEDGTYKEIILSQVILSQASLVHSGIYY